MTRRWQTAWVVALGLALFAWRELAAAAADGETIDEPVHLAYGVRGLTTGSFERGPDNSKMPVSVLNAAPAVALERLGWPVAEPRRLWLARLPTIGLGLVLGWLVFHWALTLYGPGGGALALLLYTFCPSFLAHSHLVTTDVPTALGMFGATYAFWRYRQQPRPGRLAVAAAAFGAAQLTKATALFLLPIFALIAAIDWLRRRRSSGDEPAAPARGGLMLPAAALAAAALVALNLGFAGDKTLLPLSRCALESRAGKALASLPVLRDLPVPLPLAYVQGLDRVSRDAAAPAAVYLHGRISPRGFWSYFLIAFLIKVPAGTLGLLALAAWLTATGRVRVATAEPYLLVPVVFLFAYLSFFLSLQIGLRYLLPAFPFLFVFAARVASWRPLASPRGALVGALAAWTAASSLSFHPRYIPYFNELIGGAGNGYLWLADSNIDWGQDDRYMIDVFARHSPVRVWIRPNGPIAGRIAVGFLAPPHRWLRDNFRPAAVVHGSWGVFDVSESDVERCCAGLVRAWPMPELEGDLALAGRAIGGASGGPVRALDRINDGMMGANSDGDPAHSGTAAAPVTAWFGIEWDVPQRIGRVVALPGWFSRGRESRRFLAVDYVLQQWDGRTWVDLPGTRVEGNTRLHVEHRFPAVRTRRLRLLVERERNARGTEETPDVFRAACLELAAYAP
jgi:Dolichyl-phosphate-mannose-protein mannosyltransferase